MACDLSGGEAFEVTNNAGRGVIAEVKWASGLGYRLRGILGQWG